MRFMLVEPLGTLTSISPVAGWCRPADSRQYAAVSIHGEVCFFGGVPQGIAEELADGDVVRHRLAGRCL